MVRASSLVLVLRRAAHGMRRADAVRRCGACASLIFRAHANRLRLAARGTLGVLVLARRTCRRAQRAARVGLEETRFAFRASLLASATLVLAVCACFAEVLLKAVLERARRAREAAVGSVVGGGRATVACDARAGGVARGPTGGAPRIAVSRGSIGLVVALQTLLARRSADTVLVLAGDARCAHGTPLAGGEVAWLA